MEAIVVNLIIGVLAGIVSGALVNDYVNKQERESRLKKETRLISQQLKKYEVQLSYAILYHQEKGDDDKVRNLLLMMPMFLEFTKEEIREYDENFIETVDAIYYYFDGIYQIYFETYKDMINAWENPSFKEVTNFALVNAYLLDARSYVQKL